jgi:hypothetical protein
MRVIGMDIHLTFAEAVMIDGDKLDTSKNRWISAGDIGMERGGVAGLNLPRSLR